ncbi:MAG: SDR family oxidoreductase [Mariprofundaceae bacterium]|nr:SDR family oxidoreductase [Mariprofundaceae bacterium]
MDWKNKRVILTGAAGGIGAIAAQQIASQGARLVLVDLNKAVLLEIAKKLHARGYEVHPLAINLTLPTACDSITRFSMQHLGGVDMLINNAGFMSFCAMEDESNARLDMICKVNITIPMQLTQHVLPYMQQHNSGHIINVGSTFGSIGQAYFAAYSASKFALRGFSEALNRELADTNICVSYISSRAIKTTFNPSSLYHIAKATKMNMDEPEVIVQEIIDLISSKKKISHLGFPESLFARINGLWPAFIDFKDKRKNRMMRSYTKEDKNK